MIAKLSFDPSARPPETTRFALVSSGRSLSATSSATQDDSPGSAAAAASAIAAEPPPGAASKLAVRSVKTLVASFERTVWIALPA
ncbi:hypothetical protein PAYE108092_00005 [Paracoccus yeei]